MNHLRAVIPSFAVAISPSMVNSQSVGQFILRDDFASAKAIRDVVAKSAAIPLRKRYSEMTQSEKDVIRDFYTSMGPTDDPPFPEAGLEPLVRALHQAQAKLLVTGDLYLVADVDANGEVQSVAAYGSPHPDMTKFAATALLLQKFKPALCAGTPCAQKFPFSLGFVVR